MPQATLLSIDGIDFSDYSVRGISMKLQPIANGDLARDVRGVLRDLTLEQFRKYAVSISCTDHEAPTLTDVWKGKVVTVNCIPEIGVISNTDGTLTLEMMVDDWNTDRNEYQAETVWTLSLLEI